MHALLHLLSVVPGLERELRLLPLLVRAGHTCVDIGAAMGAYTLPLALLVGGTGRVLAFEPRPGAAHRLERLASIMRLQHVSVQAAAIGTAAAVGRLVVPRRRHHVPGRSYLSTGAVSDDLDDGLVPGQHLDVRIMSLDEVRSSLAAPIDFVKCDVEGAELAVLRGARWVLSHDRPTLLCEIEERHAKRYGHRSSTVFDHLRAVGYVHIKTAAAQGLAARNELFVPIERLDAVGRLLAAR